MRVAECVILIMLGLNTLRDLRQREIFLRMTLAVLAGGIIWMIFREHQPVFAAVASLMPGALLLIISRLTAGEVGMGDGFAVLALGIWAGFEQVLYVTAGALLLLAVVSGILLLKKSRIKSLPVMPFLLGVELMYCFAQSGSK